MPIRLGDLTRQFTGQLIGDEALEITGIAPLDSAGAMHISFLSNPKFRNQAAHTQAGALILSAADHAAIGSGYAGARIVTEQPYLYFAQVAQWFAAQHVPAVQPGIHSSAAVDPSARVAVDATIGAHVTIEAEASIGAGVIIDAGCFIGRAAQIGAGSHLYANVTFHARCEIGQRGIVHSGAVIGADGFGFANDAGRWVKIPQTGRVMIGDDVEIGANTTIDRGTFSDTVIEEGVKLDNQIQIAHNCHIGAHTAIAGCVGIAGSAKIGKHCTLGGAAMIHGHLTLADHVHISAASMVARSIREPGIYTGIFPLAKHADWEKSAAIVRNLATMREKIRAFEKQLDSLTEKSS